MTMWQHFAPSNLTNPTHQHNLRVEDSPSDLLEPPAEETLESQAEYPQEAVEEVEEAAEEEEEEEEEVSLPPYQHNQQPMGEINSLAIRHSYSQGIARNQKHS